MQSLIDIDATGRIWYRSTDGSKDCEILFSENPSSKYHTVAIQLENLSRLITDCLKCFDEHSATEYLQAIACSIATIEELNVHIDKARKSLKRPHFVPANTTEKIVYPTSDEVGEWHWNVDGS